MGLVNMDDDRELMNQIKQQVYEEGYEELTGERWEGSVEALYEAVDRMELKDYQIDLKE